MADEANPTGGEQARQPDNQPIMGEIPAFAPDPAIGGEDSALIMATLFGDASNSGGDQGDLGKPSDDKAGVAAPSPAPSAQEEVKKTPGGQAAQPTGGPAQEETPAYPGAPGSQQPAGAPAPSPAPGTQPAAQPGTPASQPPAIPPEFALEMHNLKSMVTSLSQQLQQQQQPPAQAQPSGAGAQPAQPGSPTDLNQYRVDLVAPQQIAQALFGEDPVQASNALNILLSATATNAVAAAVRHVTPLIDDRLNAYAGDQSAAQRGEAVKREYYEAFPAHKNPLFDQMIQAEFQQLFAEMPTLTWGEQAKNALGARVNNKLAALGFNLALQPAPGQPGGQPQQEQQQELPAVATPQRPAAMMDGGNRPSQAKSPGNFILDTLN